MDKPRNCTCMSVCCINEIGSMNLYLYRLTTSQQSPTTPRMFQSDRDECNQRSKIGFWRKGKIGKDNKCKLKRNFNRKRKKIGCGWPRQEEGEVLEAAEHGTAFCGRSQGTRAGEAAAVDGARGVAPWRISAACRERKQWRQRSAAWEMRGGALHAGRWRCLGGDALRAGREATEEDLCVQGEAGKKHTSRSERAWTHRRAAGDLRFASHFYALFVLYFLGR